MGRAGGGEVGSQLKKHAPATEPSLCPQDQGTQLDSPPGVTRTGEGCGTRKHATKQTPAGEVRESRARTVYHQYSLVLALPNSAPWAA